MSKPIRRNIAQVSQSERNDFISAILYLKNQKFYSDNISYWDKINQIHQCTHVHPTSPSDPAENFIHWHREICNFFEAQLLEAKNALNLSSPLALHYWDWTTDPNLLNIFTNSFMGVNDINSGDVGTPLNYFFEPGGFQVINRSPGISLFGEPAPEIVSNIDINGALAQNYFGGFKTILERLHDQAHLYIGGTIREQHKSFSDPFIFLLHSNMDRIFGMWQIQNRNRLDGTMLWFPNTSVGMAFNSITLKPWNGIVDFPLTGTSLLYLTPWIPGSPECYQKTYNDPSIIAPPIYDTMDLTNLIIRDFIGDTGNEPSLPPNGVYWESPDIIVRPVDDVTEANFDTMASNVISASRLEKGQDNFIYVRVKNIGINDTSGFMYNNGNNPARDVEIRVRITPWAGSQFVFPADWTANDSTHVFPTPLSLSNLTAVIPLNNTLIAKFKLTAQQVSDIAAWGNSGWHPCLLAHVVAANDYDHLNSITQADNVAMRRNNLAQRNLTVIDVLPGIQQQIEFQFVAGNLFNKEKEMKLVIDKSKLPGNTKVFLTHKPELETILPPSKKKSFIQSSLGKKTAIPPNTENKNTNKKEAAFSFIKEQGKLYALTVKVELPSTIKTGEQLPVRIIQHNVKGEVLGGVTLLINVTGKTKKSESLPSSGKKLN